MTLVDIILLALFGVICFGLGRLHAMYTIVKAVIDATEEEIAVKPDSGPDPQLLNIEKHQGTYYAYVGEQFAGQSDSLQGLVSDMKNKRNIVSFKVAHIAELDPEERTALAEAIYNNYQIK